jgi:hypothetical protein
MINFSWDSFIAKLLSMNVTAFCHVLAVGKILVKSGGEFSLIIIRGKLFLPRFCQPPISPREKTRLCAWTILEVGGHGRPVLKPV